jgi:hypothetical protein
MERGSTLNYCPVDKERSSNRAGEMVDCEMAVQEHEEQAKWKNPLRRRGGRRTTHRENHILIMTVLTRAYARKIRKAQPPTVIP